VINPQTEGILGDVGAAPGKPSMQCLLVCILQNHYGENRRHPLYQSSFKVRLKTYFFFAVILMTGLTYLFSLSFR